MPGIREDAIRFVVLKFRVLRSFRCQLFSVIYVLMAAVNSGKMYMRQAEKLLLRLLIVINNVSTSF